MWDILVTISTWAENNSGQIQIIIALVAIYMAFKGYQKVLEQISLSKIKLRTITVRETMSLRLMRLILCFVLVT